MKNFSKKDNSFTHSVHHFNIQSHALEMLKISNNIAITIFDYLFTRSYHSYNLSSKTNFVVPGIRTVHNGQKSLQRYNLLIWNVILDYIKDLETLNGSPSFAHVAISKNIHQI